MSLTDEMCVGELSRLIQGELDLGDMPPIGGAWEPIGRCVASREALAPGDVAFVGKNMDTGIEPLTPTECYSRGALGVVVDGMDVHPWAGRFAIRVEDASAALWEVASRARSDFQGRTVVVVESEDCAASRIVEGSLKGRLTGIAHHAANTCDAVSALIKVDQTDDFSMLAWTATRSRDMEQLAELWRPDIVVATGPAGRPPPPALLDDARAWAQSLDMSGTLILDGNCDALTALACSCDAEPIVVGRGPHSELRIICKRIDAKRTVLEIDGQPIATSGVDNADLTSLGFAYAALRRMGIEEAMAAHDVSRWSRSQEFTRKAA